MTQIAQIFVAFSEKLNFSNRLCSSMYNFDDDFLFTPTLNGKSSCGLYCRAVWVCITRNFSESQNPRLIIESTFKSRAGYNGAHTVYDKLRFLNHCFE